MVVRRSSTRRGRPAVIAGHVNLDGTAGVFSALHTLVPDDLIEVFDETEAYPVSGHPCGASQEDGVSDAERLRHHRRARSYASSPAAAPPTASTGHYRDNVIVFAVPFGRLA